MKLVASATALTLALVLAACGSKEEQTSDTTTAETATVPIQPGQDIGATPGATSTPVPSATPSPEPTPTASPTPTPSPTSSPSAKPGAAATTAAAATKPAEFAQCQACHTTEAGKNGIGPSLAHVYGRKAGTVAGFDYSEPMKSSGLTWNQANLNRFLTDPDDVVSGTKMTFPGIKDAAKRQAVIAYLKTL